MSTDRDLFQGLEEEVYLSKDEYERVMVSALSGSEIV